MPNSSVKPLGDIGDIITEALAPFKTIAWGELAMVNLGVKCVTSSYCFVIEDADLQKAVERLHGAGLMDAPWSYGSMVDPGQYTDKHLQLVHRRIAANYRTFDAHSVRLDCPVEWDEQLKVVLLPPSYVHLSLDSVGSDNFSLIGENLYLPDARTLLESMVRVIVTEKQSPSWEQLLAAWAVAYMYGQLNLEDGVLDSSDEEVQAWFNKRIKRHEGGLDRVSNKRTGRLLKTVQP
ncbi:hypothetical protein Micbo1qcDRAFT_141230 [Microdochium bolleyi]|uniref:Uncharacterized protein n=1 Tax=Microdochium bolleyi TaxID=196109 RepID=A0A136ILM1_9PEZI|nr:hypothetical protein Micbo1qcDRAFT_141230 [Microdochium bolleyi]